MATSTPLHAHLNLRALFILLICVMLLAVGYGQARADYIIGPTDATTVTFVHDIELPTATVNLPLKAPTVEICNPDCTTYGGDDLSSHSLSADQGPYRLIMVVENLSGSYLKYVNTCEDDKVGALLTFEGFSSATKVLGKLQQAVRNDDGVVVKDSAGNTVFEDIDGGTVEVSTTGSGPYDATTGLCLGGIS